VWVWGVGRIAVAWEVESEEVVGQCKWGGKYPSEYTGAAGIAVDEEDGRGFLGNGDLED
jgi:hypothetical protein